jgi:Pyridoxamine 5'-phosphate oxidase
VVADRETRRLSFGSVAADYDRYRPPPPPQALDWLIPPGAGSRRPQNHWARDSSVAGGWGCDHGRMTAWRDVEQAEPEFAQRVRALFDAHRHKTIATLRADGSPRISGIEAAFEDGELVFGSMADARKGADLRRDPRFALHSATVDPVEGAEAQWPGEAKISGRALAAGPITEGPDGDRFQADIAEVVHTHLNAEATMLVVEWWTPAHGLRRTERE